ncbi:MAG: hypothetical protein IJV41_08990, partial [Oscillospiraceae bacterium]|nr:hypothetical protein [Oscillospiraceae bacterium]
GEKAMGLFPQLFPVRMTFPAQCAPLSFFSFLHEKKDSAAPGVRKKRAPNALNVVAGYRLVIAIVVHCAGLVRIYTCPRSPCAERRAIRYRAVPDTCPAWYPRAIWIVFVNDTRVQRAFLFGVQEPFLFSRKIRKEKWVLIRAASIAANR